MASYYVYSGAAGSGTGASWANAFTTLSTSSGAAGDTIYVAHDHAESSASNINIGFGGSNVNPVKVICVNRAGSVPPVAADKRATAAVTTTSARDITLTTSMFFDGIIFTASGALLAVNPGANAWMRLDNCSLRMTSVGGGQIRICDNGTYGVFIELNNTTLSFGAVGQRLDISNNFRWRNTPAALLGTIPTTLCNTYFAYSAQVECIGVDLSAAGSGKTLCSNASNSLNVKYKFVDCKLDAAVTKTATPAGPGASEVDFIRTGASGVNYTVSSHRYQGVLTEETTIVRTGGASDGTTPIAWKIVTTANCNFLMFYECPPIAIWNDTTGSARTATIEGIWGGGAVPNDDEIWLDLEYLGSSSSPQGSFVNDGRADLLTVAAAQTSSSATWGGSTTKFKLAVTFTAQQKGWIYARIKCAKASSTFYIDPLITLT